MNIVIPKSRQLTLNCYHPNLRPVVQLAEGDGFQIPSVLAARICFNARLSLAVPCLGIAKETALESRRKVS